MAIFMRTGDTNALDMSSLSKVTASQWFQRAAKWIVLVALLSILCLSTGCAKSNPPIRLLELPDRPTGREVRALSGDIKEVAPPAIFLDLANLASELQPQVEIAYPKSDQVINETEFAAKIKLRGLSIYKDEETQLGPHLKVILDNQPAQDLYTLDDPIEFSDLSPGSHTLRVFAVLPWGESFKNTTAYSQTTFHILAKTEENSPAPEQPLLTYNEPQGNFGTQPVLLDFYLNNAPLHLVAEESTEDDIQDWKIRCTINGQSFLFDQWQPIYLKGFKPGQNWVQIELIDEEGDRINGPFNSTVRLINYDPDQRDTLSKLIRGELPIEQVGQIVLPGYVPPAPAEIPAEEPVETEALTKNAAEEVTETSTDQTDVDKADVDEEESIVKPIDRLNESESLNEPAPQLETDPDNRVEENDLEEVKDLPTDRSIPTEEEVEEEEAIEKNAAKKETEVDVITQSDSQTLDASEEKEPLPAIAPLLEETPSSEESRFIPDNLSAPTSKTEVEFSDELEDAITIESPQEQSIPEADDSDSTARSEMVETIDSEKKESSQPGFLEQLKARWRSFQKGQIESQSKEIQPSTGSLVPESQIEINSNEPIDLVEPDSEFEIDTSVTDNDTSAPLETQSEQDLEDQVLEEQPEIENRLELTDLDNSNEDLDLETATIETQ